VSTIQVVTFGDCADECDKARVGDTITLSNFTIENKTRTDETNSDLQIIAESPDAHFYLFKHTLTNAAAIKPTGNAGHKASTDCKSRSYSYTDLKDLYRGTYVNVFGVVKYFKKPCRTAGPDYKSAISIIDPTHHGKHMKLSCMLFAQQGNHPPVTEIGQIVRFHRLKITEWNGTLQGQTSPGFSWLMWQSDVGASIAPKAASSTSYTVTQADTDKVEELRQWVSSDDGRDALEIKEKRMCDIRPDLYYNTTMQVIYTSPLQHGDACLLGVWDGTKSTFPVFTVPNPSESTPFAVSEPSLFAAALDYIYDLCAFDNHFTKANSIKSGDFVRFTNVHAMLHRTNSPAPGTSATTPPSNTYPSSSGPMVELCLHGGTAYRRGLEILSAHDAGVIQLKARLDEIVAPHEKVNHLVDDAGKTLSSNNINTSLVDIDDSLMSSQRAHIFRKCNTIENNNTQKVSENSQKDASSSSQDSLMADIIKNNGTLLQDIVQPDVSKDASLADANQSNLELSCELLSPTSTPEPLPSVSGLNAPNSTLSNNCATSRSSHSLAQANNAPAIATSNVNSSTSCFTVPDPPHNNASSKADYVTNEHNKNVHCTDALAHSSSGKHKLNTHLNNSENKRLKTVPSAESLAKSSFNVINNRVCNGVTHVNGTLSSTSIQITSPSRSRISTPIRAQSGNSHAQTPDLTESSDDENLLAVLDSSVSSSVCMRETATVPCGYRHVEHTQLVEVVKKKPPTLCRVLGRVKDYKPRQDPTADDPVYPRLLCMQCSKVWKLALCTKMKVNADTMDTKYTCPRCGPNAKTSLVLNFTFLIEDSTGWILASLAKQDALKFFHISSIEALLEPGGEELITQGLQKLCPQIKQSESSPEVDCIIIMYSSSKKKTIENYDTSYSEIKYKIIDTMLTLDDDS